MTLSEKNRTLMFAAFIGLCLGIGLAVCGLFVHNGIVNFRKSGRFVTVKGLAEREVKADLAIWKIRFKASGNDLMVANEKITLDIGTIREFLKKFGIADSEIEFLAPRVVDLLTREYGPERLPTNRYVIEATMQIKTPQVDQIVMASQKAIELIKAGVVLDENTYGVNPSYLYTRLNDIRPELLAEATKSARTLAEQFANDSNSKVGPIKQANQGTFTIGSYGQGDGEGFEDRLTPIKRVRVVSSIDYFLLD